MSLLRPTRLSSAVAVAWTGVTVGLVVGFVSLVAASVWCVRTLRRRPHPEGLTRVLWVVSIVGGLAVVATLVEIGVERNDAELWIAILSPVAFAVPLWLARRSHPKVPPPVSSARALRDDS